MKSVCNPKPKSGKRHVFCGDYNSCLDHVIENRWKDWDCGSCGQYLKHAEGIEILSTANDSMDIHELPYAISRRFDGATL